MYASMKDMLRFASNLAQKKSVLSPDGYEQYFLPGVDLRDGISSYGKYGWEVAYANGFRTITKGGLVGGFGSYIVILPELELGVVTWINFESGFVASEVAALVMNAVVPIILDQMEKNQPVPEVPKEIDKILGTYSVNKITYITMTRSKETGVISGTILSDDIYPVIFVYDDEMSKLYGQLKVFVFHTVEVPQDNKDSCFFLSATGVGDGLLYIQCDDKLEGCVAVMPDILYNGIPHDRNDQNSSSSSGSSGSSHSSTSCLRLVILSLFIGIAACFRRPSSIIYIVGAVAILCSVTSAASTGDFFQERGPAVNWTWTSYFLGPSCVDITNMSLRDLDPSVFEDAFNQVHDWLANAGAKFHDKVALGFGVTYNGKVIHTDFVGRINAEHDIKPDENTVISIGSITKVFTSLMMTSLADQGALKPRDPVTKYFNDVDTPAFNVPNIFNKEAGANSVTLESLSSQTSGLPRECLCHFQRECLENISMLNINYFPLYHQPLTRPHYSNVGYDLLGHCCERAARKFYGNSSITYENWLQDNLFPAFDMSSSGFDYPDDIKKRMATGYTFDAQGNLIVNPWFAKSIFWENPCGGMYSTTSDMLNFATHLLEKDVLLSQNGYEQYFFPGAILADGVSSYGKAGWEIFYANGLRTYTKGGLLGGFSTSLALVPDLKLGIFFWFNTDGTASALSAHATNLLVPIILNNLADVKPSHNVPAAVFNLIGDYDAEGVHFMTIVSDDSSNQTGVFFGDIGGDTVWYEYDEKSTNACQQQDTYYIRYFAVAEEPYDSCFSNTMGGLDDSLAMFKLVDNQWTVTVFDYMVTANKTN